MRLKKKKEMVKTWNIEGQKRKSARILALEAANQDKRKRETPAPPPAPPPPPLAGSASGGGQPVLSKPKRGRKKKRLADVASSSTVPTTRQDGENSKNEDGHVSGAIAPSVQQMPRKDILEFLLDILQRRDKHEIFAQPVDGEEVEGYYNIIKEPMDFSTMRAKLQEGMYNTFEQFEKDVYLISSNAMIFNSSSTIFFRQARAIHELAKKVFYTYKTNPERIEDEFSQARKRPGRRPQGKAESSHTTPANLERNAQARHVPSSSDALVGRRDSAVLPGSGDGKNMKFRETERRQTYMSRSSLGIENEPVVSIVYNCAKKLFPGNGGVGYKESLLRFVKHLGPTAQMVAQRKLESPTKAPIYQSRKSSNSVEDKDHLISIPTPQQGHVIDNQMPPMFHNRRDHSVFIRDASDPSGVSAATRNGKNVLPSGLTNIHYGASSVQRDTHHSASKGKNVLIGEGMDILGHSSGGMKAYASDRANIEAASELSRLMVQPAGTMSLLLQTAGDDIADRIPEPRGSYMTADTMGSRQFSDQNQLVQMASGPELGLLEFMTRGKLRPKPLVHPSKVIMPPVLSQTNTPLHGGLAGTRAQVIHNYPAGSGQVNQAMEWNVPAPQGPEAMYDFPHVYMQEADELNPMNQEYQLPSAPFTGQLSAGMNLLGDFSFLQQQLANMQLQPRAVNMFGVDEFPEGAQFGMVPSMHPQGLGFNAVNFHERAPHQGHPQHPNLNLQL